ncbi:hypothetical protein M8J76_012825 [Diaphorina citri]|nr:hypothetical protein M8J75_014601 [Diaphorina citri]KAI5733515.1 hypothetical protein M8J76_012825 [Diaphorina citri]
MSAFDNITLSSSQTHSPHSHSSPSVPLHNGTPPRSKEGGQHLSPPPYREPPPPTQSPARVSPPTSLTTIRVKPKKIIMKDLQSNGGGGDNGGNNSPGTPNTTLVYNSQHHQYRELVRLINLQRDKLSSQQMELTRYDAEIMFWEGKTREQQHQMEYIAEESLKIEAAGLGSVEEENEIVRQQEKTLESEITLLRSKLANCETELLQCKNKIRLLMEEVQFEQRLLAKESEERHHMEKSLLREVERLQGEVDQARHDTESAAQSGDKIAKEVAALESLIVEKKKQLEKLIGDMKDANLQSLTIAPSEELKLLVDGANKLGSTRRMIGSPRQLENAVPTSKNPHGVWV